jgi:hypothetical protein
VKDGPILRNVNLFHPKHGVNPPSQARFFGKFKQEPNGFISNAILGVVQEEADRFGRHPLAAAGIVEKKIA